MRVELLTPSLSVAPGATAELELEVLNTTEVIDGVSARVVGLDAQWVRCRPAQLALFPESSDTLVVQITLPSEYPAGHHELAVEVTSSVHPADVEYASFALEVVPNTDIVLQLEPQRVSAVSKARMRATALNAGNTAVALAFTAVDADRSLDFRFEPPVVEVPPGGSASADVHIRAPRRGFGAPIDRAVAITASGRDLEIPATGTFQHLPLVPRGVLTTGLLATVVALWAIVFLVVLGSVLDEEPADKGAPASFFATSAEVLAASSTEAAAGGAGGAGGAAGADGEGGAGGGQDKQLDLAAVGAGISGTVTAQSTTAGVGRITVEAYRITRTGPVLTSSAATDEEGRYSITALPPGTYAVHFASPGFVESWYPAAPSSEGATPVVLDAKEQAGGIDAVVEGVPGSLAGVVDTGLDAGAVTASVTIRPLEGGVPGTPVAVTSTDPSGAFAAIGLATPATYEITATAPGYDPTTTVENLGGGEQRLAATLRLSAGTGGIGGLVSAGGRAVGGVTVVGTSGDVEITTATPTTGAVGRYVLAGLPTPGTYLLTFTREGFGVETIAVDLGPGETRPDLDIELASGTGSISGTVTDDAGDPLGDVVVSVSGGTTAAETTTLTAGARGSWAVSGLPPGRYTVTFSAEGHASQTVAVTLGDEPVQVGTVPLPATLGSISGMVLDPDDPEDNGIAGATVVLRDGGEVRETSSASSPRGEFRATQLPAGSYAVTVSAPGYRQRTILVQLGAGESVTRNIELESLADP